MAIYLNENPKRDLRIKLIERDGEAHLAYNGHSFIRCRTNEKGENVVEIVDADTGVRASAVIEPTCWQR